MTDLGSIRPHLLSMSAGGFSMPIKEEIFQVENHEATYCKRLHQ